MLGRGVFLIDKPQGWTSHDVVAKVRRLTGVKRVGHTGTLDPLATGLLIVLVGREYTKQQARFLKLDKVYECTAQLGIVTDTYDSTGMIVEKTSWKTVSRVDEENLRQTCEQFIGTLSQAVPPFSAVKLKGKKLYDMARKGLVKEIDLPSKEVTIKTIKVLAFEKNKDDRTCFFTIKVSCSSGTYIRSLVHDIGQVLGVGAVVTALRRTQIGDYSVEAAVSLDSINTGNSSLT